MENTIRKKGYAVNPELRWVRMYQDKWLLETPPLWEQKPSKDAKLYEITIKEVKDGRELKDSPIEGNQW